MLNFWEQTNQLTQFSHGSLTVLSWFSHSSLTVLSGFSHSYLEQNQETGSCLEIGGGLKGRFLPLVSLSYSNNKNYRVCKKLSFLQEEGQTKNAVSRSTTKCQAKDD